MPTSERRTGWRGWARAYGAAVVLNVALVTGVPVGRPLDPVPIVRPFARRVGDFDPREVVGAEFVLTLPVDVGEEAPEDDYLPGLN